MNKLTTFNNPDFGNIRGTVINNEPWFVGKDVATALGYKETAKAVREHVDEEDRGVSVLDTPGGKQKIVTINESGLYSLILSSNLPTAKQFKRWVTSEVLPSIRKTGGYIAGQETLSDADLMAKALLVANRQLEERAKRVAELEARAVEDRPKVLFADSVSASKSSILVGALAKILKQNGVDIGQNRLFQKLREEGYLISRKGSDYNMPTQRAMEMGLFRIKEGSIVHADGHTTTTRTPLVTGKGQVYFVNRYVKGTEIAEVEHERGDCKTVASAE